MLFLLVETQGHSIRDAGLVELTETKDTASGYGLMESSGIMTDGLITEVETESQTMTFAQTTESALMDPQQTAQSWRFLGSCPSKATGWILFALTS